MSSSKAIPETTPALVASGTEHRTLSPAEQAEAHEYDQLASEPSSRITEGTARTPPPLLILDPNGTLLYWGHCNGNPSRPAPVLRPDLQPFLDYIFGTHTVGNKEHQNWEVVIWSSSESQNVKKMCQVLGITKRDGPIDLHQRPEQAVRREVIEIYDQSLMCGFEDANGKMRTIRDLAQIWNRLRWKDASGGDEQAWSARNTVILDDGFVKVVQEFNWRKIRRYKGEADDKHLGRRLHDLRRLRHQSNFAAYLKTSAMMKVSKSLEMPKRVEVNPILMTETLGVGPSRAEL